MLKFQPENFHQYLALAIGLTCECGGVTFIYVESLNYSWSIPPSNYYFYHFCFSCIHQFMPVPKINLEDSYSRCF